jgi:hypothetical protein
VIVEIDFDIGIGLVMTALSDGVMLEAVPLSLFSI